MTFSSKLGLLALAAPLVLSAQISITGITSTPTQAIIRYVSPVAAACSIQVADMNRSISIVSAAQASGQVTLQTAAPHGLLPGTVIYVGVNVAWNEWQTITSVPTPTSLTFATTAVGTLNTENGIIGVLVDDVNPKLFPGANLDSRPGNITSQTAGGSRTFVVGLRSAPFGADGNRHSRALQANSTHIYELTCGSQNYLNEFQTQNIPLGSTHSDGLPADRSNPGQYAYPTIQWSNPNAAIIDPVDGLRSILIPSPQGAPSAKQAFVTAVDLQSAWQNPAAPISNSGSAAKFTGPCPSGTCPLFLRTDNFVVPGGATYTNDGGGSLDWFQVTVGQASISNPACTGNDCMIVACLTVNGQTCGSGTEQVSLTGTPASYTFGTQALMDLWQGSGPPGISRVDASTASGTVNYTAATQQVSWSSGSPFNIKWGAGSKITIAGAQYTIASVQSELQLTLVSGPTGNLTAAAYSASNFGVLIWKKTATANSVSIGNTTYTYQSTPFPGWGPAAYNNCGGLVTIPSGQTGYNCFLGQELFWIAANGSDTRDLGMVATSYRPAVGLSQGGVCGMANQDYQFDPIYPNTWYCLFGLYSGQHYAIVQGQYNGSYARTSTPGVPLPDCSLNGGAQPCLQFTVLTPASNTASSPYAISTVGPAFNPDYAASGYQPVYYEWGGVSADGDILIYTRLAGGQDTIGWQWIWSLGDRTPTGTDANSTHIVASLSSYRTAPYSWCTIHSEIAPSLGWGESTSNDMSLHADQVYQTTLTSAPLTATVGAAGGLNTCPTNKFGVTGQVCTAITLNGEPVNISTGLPLQNIQVGDQLILDSERVRVLVVTGANQYTVQRGVGNSTPATHTSKVFSMGCGLKGATNDSVIFNYRADPYGANANGTTLVSNPFNLGGHNYIGNQANGPSATIAAGGGYGALPNCPASMNSDCDGIVTGAISTTVGASILATVTNPWFAGMQGAGSPNQVDTHPGPCFTGWCMDARPMDGGTTMMANTFTKVTGQLWKSAGNAAILKRKFLTTMAYVGRTPLIDISGPASVIGSTSANSYEYCYADVAGECVTGSSIGDVYVNAPYVSYAFCSYPGIAVPGDDTNAICVGPLGPFAGQLAQVGYTHSDALGAYIRALGPNYSRWNQQYIYWNSSTVPSGVLLASQVRWLDGVRHENLATVLPPYPASDGVVRNTFLPVTVTAVPPIGLPVRSAIVEFGYAENGASGTFYCTSRQETCVANGSSINLTTPFYFEQTDTHTGEVCVLSCTITVPALSQHVLYYRIKFLDILGNILETSATNAVPTP